MTEYANNDALVTTEWLEQNLDDPSLVLVEVDEDNDAYANSHIPGAIAWNWSSDLHHSVRRDYIDQGSLGHLLAESGVDDGQTVVLYGGNNNWFAAYAYWLLKLRGFDAVRLLDGGRKKWELEGRPLTTETFRPTATTFAIDAPERPELRAFRDGVLSSVADGVRFVDVRSPEEFNGTKLAPDHLPQEQPYVGGHIPGAVNVPWSRAAREDGSFRSADELAEIYASAGVNRAEQVIAYCRIGERSSHTWFVLHELLGLDAVNYDGSWTEYGSMVAVPVER